MTIRIATSLVPVLVAGCGPSPAITLPGCWTAADFENTRQIDGLVTVVAEHFTPGQQATPVVAVAPLTCEGAVLVDNPSEFDLSRPSWPERKGALPFGFTAIARIAGTVRLDRSGAGQPHGYGPYRITLTKVDGLKPVDRPAWWSPPTVANLSKRSQRALRPHQCWHL